MDYIAAGGVPQRRLNPTLGKDYSNLTAPPFNLTNGATIFQGSPPDTTVVHLLRQCNPPEAFIRFVESYRRTAESLPHDLVVIFKGFDIGEDAWALEALAGVRFQRVDWPDIGYFEEPFLYLGRSLPYRYFCFLNSWSCIQAENWLTKLSDALHKLPQAGVVGATGSWQSIFSDRPFPNYHLRTNAFLISKEHLCLLHSWPMRDKLDTYRFESGANGLTSQLLKFGLEPYVVDGDGRGWRKEHWHLSRTFRSFDQEGLLVADNQTNAYQYGISRRRRRQRRYAWMPQRNHLSRRIKEWLGIRLPAPLSCPANNYVG